MRFALRYIWAAPNVAAERVRLKRLKSHETSDL